MREWIEPPDVEPVCPRHGCALYPARPIPCPECEIEAEEEDELSIMLDEANAYERGMDDDLTFQTVREIAGTAYMAGRSAPPTAVEIEAVAKRLCWNSCKWDGVDSYAATDEDDAWNYAGEIPGFHEEYIRQAKEMLEIARKAANE